MTKIQMLVTWGLVAAVAIGAELKKGHEEGEGVVVGAAPTIVWCPPGTRVETYRAGDAVIVECWCDGGEG